MNEHLVWRDISPEETFSFWEKYLHQQPLPPAIPLEAPTLYTPFETEDTTLFLGEKKSRESLIINPVWHNDAPGFPQPVASAKRSCFPYCTVGKLLFALVVDGAFQTFEGSAFVMHTRNKRAVFTAGHCLFSERTPGITRQWAQHVVFIPFFDTHKKPLLSYFDNGEVYAATGLGVSKKWYESGLDTRYEYDLGCFLVADSTPGLQEKTGALGWMAGDYPDDQYRSGLALGYPVGPEFAAGDFWESAVDLSFQKFVGGFPHFRMNGHQFSRGASGGPVMVGDPGHPDHFYTLGLHASVSNHGTASVYWDAPRFGAAFCAMVDFLEKNA